VELFHHLHGRKGINLLVLKCIPEENNYIFYVDFIWENNYVVNLPVKSLKQVFLILFMPDVSTVVIP
jgi:hypothetical protein